MIPSVFFKKVNHCGVITLSKPETLNSIDLSMLSAIEEAIDVGLQDDAISHFILKSDVPNIFSAGGDLKQVYAQHQNKDMDKVFLFLEKSYQLNHKINQLKKPFVSFVNGLAMGGGLGLALNSTYTIMFDKALMAMPEVYIGFFPDVGARYFLKRSDDVWGAFLGVTGYRANPADALCSGISTHYVPFLFHDDLVRALIETDITVSPHEGINHIIGLFSAEPPMRSELEAHKREIQDLFSMRQIDEIIPAMHMSKFSWIRRLGEQMTKEASPLSIALAFEILKKGARPASLQMALKQDLRLAHKLIEEGEPIEGTRALLIDKDKAPNWKYKDIYSVPVELIHKLTQPE